MLRHRKREDHAHRCHGPITNGWACGKQLHIIGTECATMYDSERPTLKKGCAMIKNPNGIAEGDSFLCGQGVATVGSVFYDSRHDHANCLVTLTDGTDLAVAVTVRRPIQVWSV